MAGRKRAHGEGGDEDETFIEELMLFDEKQKQKESICCLIDSIQEAARDSTAMLVLSAAGVPKAILSILNTHRGESNIIRSCLRAFYLITDTMSRPMIDIGEEAARDFVDAIDIDPEAASHAIFVSCVFHEGNRKHLWEAKVAVSLKDSMQTGSEEAARYSCETLSAFASNHEYAKTLMELGIGTKAVEALTRHKKDPNVTYAACLLIGRLAQWKDNCDVICMTGAIGVIMEAIDENISDPDSANAACCALFWLWENGIPDYVSLDNTVRVLLNVISTHSKNANCMKVALDVFCRLSPCLKDLRHAILVGKALIQTLQGEVMVNLGAILIALEMLAPLLPFDLRTIASAEITKRMNMDRTNLDPFLQENDPILISSKHAILSLEQDSGVKTAICELCRNNEVTYVLRDCGHACLCENCSQSLFLRPYRACPYPTCRKKVTKQPLRFFLPGKTSTPKNSTSSTKQEQGDSSSAFCVICLVEKASQVWEECGHACICVNCTKTLFNAPAKKTCPVCRKVISKVCKFSFPWEETAAVTTTTAAVVMMS